MLQLTLLAQPPWSRQRQFNSLNCQSNKWKKLFLTERALNAKTTFVDAIHTRSNTTGSLFTSLAIVGTIIERVSYNFLPSLFPPLPTSDSTPSESLLGSAGARVWVDADLSATSCVDSSISFVFLKCLAFQTNGMSLRWIHSLWWMQLQTTKVENGLEPLLVCGWRWRTLVAVRYPLCNAACKLLFWSCRMSLSQSCHFRNLRILTPVSIMQLENDPN